MQSTDELINPNLFGITYQNSYNLKHMNSILPGIIKPTTQNNFNTLDNNNIPLNKLEHNSTLSSPLQDKKQFVKMSKNDFQNFLLEFASSTKKEIQKLEHLPLTSKQAKELKNKIREKELIAIYRGGIIHKHPNRNVLKNQNNKLSKIQSNKNIYGYTLYKQQHHPITKRQYSSKDKSNNKNNNKVVKSNSLPSLITRTPNKNNTVIESNTNNNNNNSTQISHKNNYNLKPNQKHANIIRRYDSVTKPRKVILKNNTSNKITNNDDNNPKSLSTNFTLIKTTHNSESNNCIGKLPEKQKSNLETILTVECTEKDDIEIPQSNLDKYTIGKEIGKGAYAIVKHCIHKETKEHLAIKIYNNTTIKNNKTKKHHIIKEINILKELNHVNLIKLYDYFQDEHSLYIVMEEAKGIPLLTFLKSNYKYDELRAKRIFTQLLRALAYLHQNNICHRDIKLDNIIIDDSMSIKLIDFGFGSHFEDKESKLNLFCGTPSYMPPEIIKKESYYGPPVDMWSAGVVLFNLLCNTFPFKGVDEKDLFQKICNGGFNIPNNVSTSAQNLLRKLLCVNPQSRIKADVALKHDWIVKLMDVFSYNLKKKGK